MSYYDIKPISDPKKPFYYKIALLYRGMYYGVWTYSPLPRDRWVKSKSVIREIKTYSYLVGGVKCTLHSVKIDVCGFGVFSTIKRAQHYFDSHFCYSSSNFEFNIIKVAARGNPRKATMDFPRTYCYLFDEIKLIEKVIL
jgi:hypothetical protein